MCVCISFITCEVCTTSLSLAYESCLWLAPLPVLGTQSFDSRLLIISGHLPSTDTCTYKYYSVAVLSLFPCPLLMLPAAMSVAEAASMPLKIFQNCQGLCVCEAVYSSTESPTSSGFDIHE